MAKFLNYEDRLEIENGLKEHMTFTQIGEKLGRDRTTITKEIRNYSIERDTGYGSYPHNTCKYRKTCKRKKVCGTNDCKHPLVTVCKQCESICNRKPRAVSIEQRERARQMIIERNNTKKIKKFFVEI